MKLWIDRAVTILGNTLSPVPQEKNELDWKSGLSNNTEKLAKHLSAFSNILGGGFLVFGVNDDGTISGISEEQCRSIVNTLGNIARNGLESPICLDSSVETFQGHPILIIYIAESDQKPVHLRNQLYEAYTRSAGQTRKMSKQELSNCITQASSVAFEEKIALSDIAARA